MNLQILKDVFISGSHVQSGCPQISCKLEEEVQDNIDDDKEEEGDGDEEAGEDLYGLGGGHPSHGDQDEKEAVLKEGEEDDEEAGEHPDVDVGGIGDEGHAALDTVVQSKDAEQDHNVHPASQPDPVDRGNEGGEVGNDGEEQGGKVEHEDVVEGQPLEGQSCNQTRLHLVPNLGHVVLVVETVVKTPLRQMDVMVGVRVDAAVGLLHPPECVVVGGVGEAVEDDVAGLVVEGKLPEVHVARDVKVHPLCIADHAIAVDPDTGGVDEVAGVPGVTKTIKLNQTFSVRNADTTHTAPDVDGLVDEDVGEPKLFVVLVLDQHQVLLRPPEDSLLHPHTRILPEEPDKYTEG